MKTCSVEGCDRPHHCKGMCGMHYQRDRSRGTTDAPRPREQGDRHHRSKVSTRTIERMRVARARGVQTAELAREYGLHPDSVSRLIHGRGRIADLHRGTDVETSLTNG